MPSIYTFLQQKVHTKQKQFTEYIKNLQSKAENRLLSIERNQITKAREQQQETELQFMQQQAILTYDLRDDGGSVYRMEKAFGVLRHFQQYFNYIVAVSFIVKEIRENH